MAKYKVGLNGFGRIARIILSSLELRETDIEIVGINLHNANHEHMAYRVEYDSVCGAEYVIEAAGKKVKEPLASLASKKAALEAQEAAEK